MEKNGHIDDSFIGNFRFSKNKKLFYKIWWVVAFLFLSGMNIHCEYFPKKEQQIYNEETEIQGEKTKTTPYGLNLSRVDFTSVLEKPAIGFFFEEGCPVNGQENFVANKGGCVVRILGPCENLQEALIIAFLGKAVGENMISFADITIFAKIIDQSSVDWVLSELKKIVSNPTREYSNSKMFGDKIFNVEFTLHDLFPNSFRLVYNCA